MDIRDRVIELRKVPANELLENPKNWRKHPPSQRSAMLAALSEIGLADAVIARETPDGLQLIDGHLRQEILGNTPVPVLIVDLTAEEADKLLLTLDPMAAMAITDTDTLLALLEQTTIHSSALNDMLEGLANGERYPMPDLTWDTDIADIASISPLDSPILGKIVIECPVLIAGDVREAIEETLKGYPDARIA